MIDALNAIYPGLGWVLLGFAIGLPVAVIIGLLLERYLKRRQKNEQPR